MRITTHHTIRVYLLTRGGGGYSLYWPILGSSALEGWLQVYDEKVGVLLIEVYERVGKSFIWVCDRAQRAE